jgi:hypothetical protein
LNEYLLTAGLAWNYRDYNKLYPDEYAELESVARRLKTGLWLQPNSVEPWVYRKEGKKRRTDNHAASNVAARKSGKTVYVRGYYRKDGTYVKAHTRKVK